MLWNIEKYILLGNHLHFNYALISILTALFYENQLFGFLVDLVSHEYDQVTSSDPTVTKRQLPEKSSLEYA